MGEDKHRRSVKMEEDKHRRGVNIEEGKHRRSVNGGGYCRRRIITGGVYNGGYKQEEERYRRSASGFLGNPGCWDPLSSMHAEFQYFWLTVRQRCSAVGPGHLAIFQSARRHSACMQGVVGCLRPAVRTPREGVFFLSRPLGAG